MKTQKYSVNQYFIEDILSWVRSGEIAIPEIQRPFVWDATKVRNLMDSLYQGYPIGYIIAWKNPNVRLKDGSLSEGKKILIDGQQRITALRAALLSEYIIDKKYKQKKVKIAFHPIDEKFEVQTPVIRKDKAWIEDISEAFISHTHSFQFIKAYQTKNPAADEAKIVESIGNLFNLPKKVVGLIELNSDLDIETVTEIFVRINSEGVELSSADFAMSKIAASNQYDGVNLRKTIDYFCHLAVAPEFYPRIRDNDTEFAKTEYFKKLDWLKNELDDLYDPNYKDVIRVVVGIEFKRGKISDLISLLSGRNFESKTFEEKIAKESFQKLRTGILRYINETDFKRFLMIIKSAGFVRQWMIRSQNALNFAYLLYLILREQKTSSGQIEKYVARWFVMSILTGRTTGQLESQFDGDIKLIESRDIKSVLAEIEDAELGDSFWSAALPQALESTSANSPYWYVFLAAQVKSGDLGFLSKDIKINEMLEYRGDIHHIFPKMYLKKHGYKRKMFNQVANYVYMQSEINIKIGQKSPADYMEVIKEQCNGTPIKYGSIDSERILKGNLIANCIPLSIYDGNAENFEGFLEARRKLMAKKIKEYYQSL